MSGGGGTTTTQTTALPSQIAPYYTQALSAGQNLYETGSPQYYPGQQVVKMLMAHDGGTLNAARVRIDGSGGRDFQRALNSYLRRELGARIKDVKMADSERDPLMQLADMCIGAITRAERDRDDRDRWKDMLKPQMSNIWRVG